MSLSKAIVAADCDGNRDLVRDNQNGFLLKQEDTSSMSKRIIELINNEETRTKFENQSQKIFDQEFNLDKNIKNLERIYLNYCAK